MYNKLFTKILDSSIWLADYPTRLVWVTLLAAMDQDGFCQFSAIGNLAARARVTQAECIEALHVLEGPDAESADPEHEGRRIERMPGGWIVLNSLKYRKLGTTEMARDANRIRMQRTRAGVAVTAEAVRDCADVCVPVRVRADPCAIRAENVLYADAEAEAEEQTHKERAAEKPPARSVYVSPSGDKPKNDDEIAMRAGAFVRRYQELYVQHRNGARCYIKPALDYQTAKSLCETWTDDARLEKLAVIFLTSNNDFAKSGSRSIGQFAAQASWCDGLLAEAEAGVTP